MASAMRKMAVYLGLVEDDHRYDDPYTDEYGDTDDYGDYVTEYADHVSVSEAHAGFVGEDGRGRTDQRTRSPNRCTRPTWPGSRRLHPRTYNEAQDNR